MRPGFQEFSLRTFVSQAAIASKLLGFAPAYGPPIPEYKAPRLHSPARGQATGGLPTYVIPDAIQPILVVEMDGLSGLTSKAAMNMHFIEVKAVAGTISLAHSRYQIRGMIDVLSMQRTGVYVDGRRIIPIPMLTFITTGDTVIGADVLAEATLNRVAIWQSIVSEDGSPTNPLLQIGSSHCLNPSVYAGFLPSLGPPGLTGYLNQPVGAFPPDHPDPTEVQ